MFGYEDIDDGFFEIDPIRDNEMVLYVYDSNGGAKDIVLGYSDIKNFIERYEEEYDI